MKTSHQQIVVTRPNTNSVENTTLALDWAELVIVPIVLAVLGVVGICKKIHEKPKKKTKKKHKKKGGKK